MRAWYAVTFGAFLLIPVVGAIPMGTFENPELTDGRGDVAYGDHYVGPRPIESIDFLRGWVEYQAVADQVAFHTHFVDLTDWQRATTDSLECRLLGDLEIDGVSAGRLTLEWTRRENQDKVFAAAYHDKDTATRRPLGSSWEAEFERPGNFTIFVPRNDLAAIATDVQRLYLTCDHVQYVPSTDVGFGNSDIAASDESFTFADLRPEGGDAEEEVVTPTVAATPESPADATTALGLAAVCAGLVVAVLARRRP